RLTLAAVVRKRFDHDLLVLVERPDRELDSFARRDQDLLSGQRPREQAPVAPDDGERPAADGEADVAGVRRIDDPPALDRACRHLELGSLLSVYEQDVSL